jgi:hypothetical protein
MITKYNPEEQSLNEELNELNEELIEEYFQVGDTVKLEDEKGYVIGQTNDGDLIIQVQGSTHRISPDSKKLKGEKRSVTVKPHMEFDKISQKLLFEQYVKCGIYYGNTAIKTTNCYVKFSDYNNATDEQPVNVLIENIGNFLPKNRIRVYEDINDFANPENYIKGYIVDENEEPLEPVMINAADYTHAMGDADPVRVVRQGAVMLNDQEEGNELDNQTIETLPKGTLRTFSV